MGYLLTTLSLFFNSLKLSVSMHLILSLTGIVFLGMPTVAKISLYTLAIAEKGGLSPWFAFGLAFFIGMMTAIFFAWLFTRVSLDSFAMLGLASVIAVEALAYSLDDVTNGVLGISGVMRPELLAQLPSLVLFTGILAVSMLLLEFILLKTWIGRAVRAYKEEDITLESMGIPTKKLAKTMIMLSSAILIVEELCFLWRVQFLDPATSGLHFLIQLITLAILAFQPKLRLVVFAALFLTFVPELLRFAQFPSSILGYARSFSYALLLMILLYKLASNFLVAKRTI